jgi:PAS domain S-box-containing protein
MTELPPSAAVAGPLGDDELLLGLDLAQLAVWRHDLGSGWVQGNQAARRLLGEPASTQGWSWPELMNRVHPDDRAAMQAAGLRAQRQNLPGDLSVRFLRHDGQWRHAWTRRVLNRDAQGQPRTLVLVALDITVRQEALARLRQADQRIALTTRALGIGTWEFDLPDGPSRWDEQMFLLRGLPVADEPPTLEQMFSLVHPQDRQAARQRVRDTLTEDVPRQYEFRVLLPGGEVRWLASRSVLLRDDHGRPMRRIGVNWDITETREAALVRQEQALARRESEAKSTLLARLSHELRTPLNAILGFTQLLLTEAPDDAEVRQRRLEHIHGAGRHLLALIDDVLTLARPAALGESPALQAVPLDALLADTLPLVEQAATEQAVTLQHRASGLAVRADPVRLRQVVLNLLTNAIKYNRPGGRVEIEASPVGAQVALTVRDTGIGMPPAELSSVFEPFRRLQHQHPGVEGMGLGLAVVRSLVERMGGSVSALSTPGVGSEFQVMLPAARDQPMLAAQETAASPPLDPPVAPAPWPAAGATGGPADAAPAPPAARRLLYIEDNEVNTLIMAELVARRGDLQFDSAPDARSGLALARAHPPDLLLLDMQLPDGHGLEVLDRLRADPLTRQVPCIAVSANALPQDIARALAHGFADYWTKPLDFTLVNQALALRFGPPPTAD